LDLPGVARVLDGLKEIGLVTEYAIGGAYAVAAFSEAVSTEDLDVFCHLKHGGLLIDLAPVYAHLAGLGYPPEGDAVLIEGFPVQFLVAPTALVNEAIDTAAEVDLAGQRVRVFDLEYLIAIALDLGRPKDKLRIEQMLQVTTRPIDFTRLETLLSRHAPALARVGEASLLDRWKRYILARDG
jgi:hypothetical protein